MTGDAANNGCILWIGVVDDDVTDDNASQSAHCGLLFGPTRAIAEPQKDWRVADIAHSDVCNRHVFEQRSVNGLEGEAPGVIKDTIGDGDVLEAAVRFSTKLD